MFKRCTILINFKIFKFKLSKWFRIYLKIEFASVKEVMFGLCSESEWELFVEMEDCGFVIKALNV